MNYLTYSNRGADIFKRSKSTPFLESIAPENQPENYINAPIEKNTNQILGNASERKANELLYGETGRNIGGNMSSEQARTLANINTVPDPKIKETVNQKRLSDLSAINSSAKVNADNSMTNTYSIGDNSLSVNLSDRDLQIKNNLAKINDLIASGVSISPEQMQRIQNIKEQAGYLRGGTDISSGQRKLANPNSFKRGNLDITFDDSVDQSARQRFLENPVRPTAQINRYNEQQASRQGLSQGQLASMNANQIINPPRRASNKLELFTRDNSDMGWQTRRDLNKQLIANSQADKSNRRNVLANLQTNNLDNLTRQNIATSSNLINKEKNRIDELNTIGQNKYRDAQIETAKQGKVQPNQIKVVDDIDPATGMKIGQRIININPNNNQAIDVNANQSFNESQQDITNQLIQMRKNKDPRLAAAERKYMKHFGSLPY